MSGCGMVVCSGPVLRLEPYRPSSQAYQQNCQPSTNREWEREQGPYTMESSVAARDATPAVTVAAASNFCPVPPLIFVDSPRAWNGWTGCA